MNDQTEEEEEIGGMTQVQSSTRTSSESGRNNLRGVKKEGRGELNAPPVNATMQERRLSEPDSGRERGSADLRPHENVGGGEYGSGDEGEVERYYA